MIEEHHYFFHLYSHGIYTILTPSNQIQIQKVRRTQKAALHDVTGRWGIKGGGRTLEVDYSRFSYLFIWYFSPVSQYYNSFTRQVGLQRFI